MSYLACEVIYDIKYSEPPPVYETIGNKVHRAAMVWTLCYQLLQTTILNLLVMLDFGIAWSHATIFVLPVVKGVTVNTVFPAQFLNIYS